MLPTPLPGSVPRWIQAPLIVLFVLAIPLALIGNSVRWVTLDPSTYSQGFARYDAAGRSGIEPAELERLGQAFRTYFVAPPGRLEPVVVIAGASKPLFTEREIHHMQDVQKLMQLVFKLGLAATVYLILIASLGVVLFRADGAALLGRLLLVGAALVGALLLVLGGLSLLDFSHLFVRFHELSFSNDLWILDPTRDFLLILFPEGFWFDATIRIALITATGAALIGAAGIALLRLVD